MNLTKKIISAAAALCMASAAFLGAGETAFPHASFLTASAAEYSSEDFSFEYSELDDGTMEITGYISSSSTDIVIPSEIDGKKVTRIGDNAFEYNGSLTSITIPDSVESIGYSAFIYCEGLTSITIPDSVTSIGICAFNGCSSLKSIIIPDGVTEIGSEAFSDCLSLTDINVSKYNKYYTDIDGILFDKNMENLVQYPAGNLRTSYSVPDSVTTIADYTFLNCPNLTRIVIPDSVKTIGMMVFGDNQGSIDDNGYYINTSNLEYIEIGSGVTSIDSGAFCMCYKLKGITVSDDNENYSSLDGVLFNKSKTELIQYPIGNIRETYTIPDSVHNLGREAFEYSQYLNKVIIPENVDYIGYYAFADCKSLASITIPDSVTSIGNGAFQLCKNLSSVTIPNSVTYIGQNAFWQCYRLKSITILNPQCEIYDYSETISDSWDEETWSYIYTGTIYGYAGSTAQEYAEKYNRNFAAISEVKGDLNNNGTFNVSDMVTLQSWLLEREAEIINWKNGDLNDDGRLDIFDIVLMRRLIAQNLYD